MAHQRFGGCNDDHSLTPRERLQGFYLCDRGCHIELCCLMAVPVGVEPDALVAGEQCTIIPKLFCLVAIRDEHSDLFFSSIKQE